MVPGPVRIAFKTTSLAALVAAACALPPSNASAFDRFLVVPEPDVAEASPAYRYANMSNDEALAELDARKVLYTKLDASAAPGVRAPIRLTGRLHGVYIHSSLPPEERVTSVYEILDARLALALDDFAVVLAQHDVDEVMHFTMYRPGGGGSATHDRGEEVEAPAKNHARPSAVVTPKDRGVKAPASKPAAPAKPPPSLGKGALDGKAPAASPHRAKQKNDPVGDKGPAAIIQAPPAKPAAQAGAKPVAKSSAQKPSKSSHGKHPAVVAHRDPQATLPVGHASANAPIAPAPIVNAPANQGPKSSPAAPGTRHPAGLAIDVGAVHKRNGRWMSVAALFHGHIGDATCGDGAKAPPEDSDAREMRALVCEPGALGLFTYVLTPNYNAAHVDHFHMEIKPGVRWFLYH